MPEIEKVLPKYLQIAGHIRDQIVRGDLLPGQDVPSERELAQAWSVARPTAARALEALRLQGLVESRPGSGTYVKRSNAAVRIWERFERARTFGTMYSPAEAVEIIAAEVTSGPDHVVQGLQLPTGSRVLKRARLIRDGEGRPIEMSTSWFAPELAEQAPRLLDRERLLGGTPKYLAEVTGRAPAYARDQVAARLASPDECALLDLAAPAAVLVYRISVHDRANRPLQFDEATYPPDRWAFRQEYPLDL